MQQYAGRTSPCHSAAQNSAAGQTWLASGPTPMVLRSFISRRAARSLSAMRRDVGHPHPGPLPAGEGEFVSRLEAGLWCGR
jgi:hypothetical protein